MAEARRQLLTLGALLIVIVAGLLLVPFIGWYLVVPVILMLFGLWLLALGLMRSGEPQKYERNAFSTLSLGLLLIAVGGGLSMPSSRFQLGLFTCANTAVARGAGDCRSVKTQVTQSFFPLNIFLYHHVVIVQKASGHE